MAANVRLPPSRNAAVPGALSAAAGGRDQDRRYQPQNRAPVDNSYRSAVERAREERRARFAALRAAGGYIPSPQQMEWDEL